MARYKDIDAIIEQMNGSTAETWGKGLGRSWWSHSVMLKDNIVQLMKDAPEADVVEVRHGEWMRVDTKQYADGSYSSTFSCSLCHRVVRVCHEHYYDENKSVKNMYPYCHCGAKMDKGVTE